MPPEGYDERKRAEREAELKKYLKELDKEMDKKSVNIELEGVIKTSMEARCIAIRTFELKSTLNQFTGLFKENLLTLWN